MLSLVAEKMLNDTGVEVFSSMVATEIVHGNILSGKSTSISNIASHVLENVRGIVESIDVTPKSFILVPSEHASLNVFGYFSTLSHGPFRIVLIWTLGLFVLVMIP